MSEYSREHVAQYPLSIALNGAGVGTGRYQNNLANVQIVVVQISVRTAPTKGGCTCNVFQNAFLVDTSYFAGTGDSASGPPALYLDPDEYLDFNFSAGPPNGQGIVTVYYLEMQ